MRTLALLVFSAGVLFAATLFIRNAVASEFPWINHDVAFFTYAGSEILKGSQLYVDFIDENPPGSSFLQAGVLLVARALGMSAFLLSHLLVLSLAAAGLLVLSRCFPRPRGDLTFVFVALGYLLVVVRGNFSNNIIPSDLNIPYDFGQREQLFSLVFLPYLLWRVSGRGASRLMLPYLIALGYLAMLKPYWPILVAVVELYTAVRERRRPPSEYAALGLGMLLPYLGLLLHSYDSFLTFFSEVLWLHLGGAYSHYDTSLLQFTVSPLHVQMLSGGLIFFLCWSGCLHMRLVDRPTLLLMAFVVVGSYLTVVHQHKFWSYHGMVYFGSVVVLSAFLLSAIVRAKTRGRIRLVIVAASVVAMLILAGVSLNSMRGMLERHLPKGFHLVPLLEGHEKVMFFSTSVDYCYAPVLLRLETVGPWSVHNTLPSLLAIPDLEERGSALQEYAWNVAARIEEAEPELLLFAPWGQALPRGVSIHDVLYAYGAVPKGKYLRIPDRVLVSKSPFLRSWVVYKRSG